jgi:hypothetical protein
MIVPTEVNVIVGILGIQLLIAVIVVIFRGPSALIGIELVTVACWLYLHNWL